MILSPLRDENDLNTFCDRLNEVETRDLKWMIGFVRAAIGVDPAGNCDGDDDEQCRKNLLRFRNRCVDLIDSGVANFILTYAIITFVCNYLRQRGDPNWSTQNNQWISGAAEFFKYRRMQVRSRRRWLTNRSG